MDSKTSGVKFRKVQIVGGTVVLTLGKIIPQDWQLVELIELKRPGADRRVIEIKRVK